MRYIKLVLDFYHPWANNCGFYYGRDLGFYKAEGIDLDIVSYDPYRGDSLGRLLADEADFAYNYPNRLMLRNEAGDNLLSIAACNNRSFEALIYDKRHPITSFAELEDKVVGVPRSPRVRAVLKYMMAKAGKDPARVSFKEYYPNEPDPLDIHKGVVDCIYGTFWGWEGVLACLQDENIAWKEVSELNAPYCHTQIIAVKKSFAHQDPQLVRGFLRATYKGFAAAAEQPTQAAESMVLVAPYYSKSQFTASITAIAETWHLDAWGRHNMPLIAAYAHWLAAHGFLEAEKGHDKYFTDEYLPE
ncbi:MAG TPA: ABC transporter substrate-binding protein [Firmicutes bacterium]|nr:ABC transporter substrate-binding protein [Bacillota bacterium]